MSSNAATAPGAKKRCRFRFRHRSDAAYRPLPEQDLHADASADARARHIEARKEDPREVIPPRALRSLRRAAATRKSGCRRTSAAASGWFVDAELEPSAAAVLLIRLLTTSVVLAMLWPDHLPIQLWFIRPACACPRHSGPSPPSATSVGSRSKRLLVVLVRALSSCAWFNQNLSLAAVRSSNNEQVYVTAIV